MDSHSALRPSPKTSVLLVEDDPYMRRALTHTLDGAGYAVSTANDGAEALRMLATTSAFDLAILDIFMPNVDGFDLLDVLRRQPRRMPVLMISAGGVATTGSEALRQARLLGADSALAKPFTPEELLAAVTAVLAGTIRTA